MSGPYQSFCDASCNSSIPIQLRPPECSIFCKNTMGFMSGSSHTQVKNQYYGTQLVSGKVNRANKVIKGPVGATNYIASLPGPTGLPGYGQPGYK